MENIIRLLQKKQKLKETLERINNDSRYRNISFVCAGNLRKGSRNYMNRMTEKLCRTYDELERCKRAIKIVTGGYFGLDDVDACRMDIMSCRPEYGTTLTLYEPIVYYVEIIRKSFLGKYRNVLDNYPIRLDFDTPNHTVFWVYSNNIILHRSKDRLEKHICLENK